LKRIFSQSTTSAARALGKASAFHRQRRSIRQHVRRSHVELLELRTLLAATNIGAVRPDLVNSPFLLEQYLDTDPLPGPRDSGHEITFDFGLSSIATGAGTLGNDMARGGPERCRVRSVSSRPGSVGRAAVAG
jgi:hypothetical protein